MKSVRIRFSRANRDYYLLEEQINTDARLDMKVATCWQFSPIFNPVILILLQSVEDAVS